MSDLLVTGAVVEGAGRSDVRVRDGVIVEVGTGLVARPGEPVLDAAGGELLVGLHDHHIHLRATAAAAWSVVVGPPEVTELEGLRTALSRAAARVAPGGWIRAVGYHESVAGRLDADLLDALVAEVPVRVQHRSGAEWVLNHRGLAALRVDDVRFPGVERDDHGRPTGRLVRLDRWLGERLGPAPVDFATLGARAAGLGVTGFTEATPDLGAEDVAQLADAVGRGDLPQRVYVMCPPTVAVPEHPRLSPGPAKVLLDDGTIPLPDDLAAAFDRLHQAGSAVAVHCVTRLQLVVTLSAFAGSGTVDGDRIEHGGIVPAESIGDLARLGLTVVTNPGFVAARGDQYLEDVAPEDLPDLYRCASLRAGGVAVAAGSDAPFGPFDPWRVAAAATDRRTGSGIVLGPDERVPATVARALFSGRPDRPAEPRRVAPGEPGDLCLVAPGSAGADVAPEAPRAPEVWATVVDGSVVFER